MRNLTATLCLTIAVLLGVTGCKTTTKLENPYVFHGTVFEGYPPCMPIGPGSRDRKITNSWHNCGGAVITFLEGGMQGWDSTAQVWIKGKPSATGKVRTVMRRNNQNLDKDCTYNLISGKIEGWHICNTANGTERKYYVNGKHSLSKENELQQATHFQKCEEIGFKPKTDKFADCVLRLMEMQSNKSPQTVIQNNSGDSSAVRALLEEQKKQRQLEGALELMKRSSEMLNPPKPRITCKYNALTKTTVCN
jgi:hypothetical protein